MGWVRYLHPVKLLSIFPVLFSKKSVADEHRSKLPQPMNNHKMLVFELAEREKRIVETDRGTESEEGK